jgi:hypothetical protein
MAYLGADCATLHCLVMIIAPAGEEVFQSEVRRYVHRELAEYWSVA